MDCLQWENDVHPIVWWGLFAFVSAHGAAQAQSTLEGRVVGITDGDTLTLLVDRTQHKIRLAQIDTPERAQPWGNKAKRALSKKVHRKTVTVRVSDTDRYGRLIGEIWLGDRDINRELIREGYAWAYRLTRLDGDSDRARCKSTCTDVLPFFKAD
jgi:endonuclease YncB( thermonuclease family)